MAKKKSKPATAFVVKSAVQAFAKKSNMMVGSDSYDAINKAIEGMLKAASARTKANGRKTLKAYDF